MSEYELLRAVLDNNLKDTKQLVNEMIKEAEELKKEIDEWEREHEEGEEETAEKGLEDWEIKSINEYTPALITNLAVSNDSEDIIKILLTAGFDPGQTDDRGRNCLHWASLEGNAKLVRFLLENTGIDVNQKDDDGFSPLDLAVLSGSEETVKVLLEYGAK